MILDYEQVREKIRSVEGLISEEESAFLFNLTHTTPLDATIVEIGSHCGKSSVSIGFACMGTNRQLICIDCWLNEYFFEKWKENITRLELNSYVVPFRGFSGQVFKEWDEKMIDFIFIDGNHGISDVAKDFSMSYHWIKWSGIIAFHDVGHPAYPGALQFWEAIKGILNNHQAIASIRSGRKMIIN